MPAELTAQRVRELLHYDPDSGIFTWRAHRGRAAAGAAAGCKNKALGYLLIAIDRRHFYGHRLAWLYVHGRWPAQQIDHINGNGLDNRISNLREADFFINAQNQRKARVPGKLLGAFFDKSKSPHAKQWYAVVKTRRQITRLGYFDTEEAAHRAYVDAKRRLHAGCTI